MSERARVIAQENAAQLPEGSRLAFDELHLYQVELEMQNDELRVSRTAFEETLDQYVDLYNLAPVGYCTISQPGVILQANLTASNLLGMARGEMESQSITRFILKGDQDIYDLQRKRLLNTGEPQLCELRMVKNDGTQFWAEMATTATKDGDGAPVVRMVMSDVTERKHLEQALVSVVEGGQRSIGQELHDSLGQHLGAIAYQAKALEKRILAMGDADTAKVAADISTQAQNAVMQCKQIAQGLLPFDLEANGLMIALQAFAAKIAMTYEITCDFVCEHEVIINDDNLALNLYRIAQEAVNNAIRHGDARHLTISLVARGGTLGLSILDDGRGFGGTDVNRGATPGMGIKIMQHRARQVGATLELLFRAEGGTEVRVEVRRA